MIRAMRQPKDNAHLRRGTFALIAARFRADQDSLDLWINVNKVDYEKWLP